MNEDLEFVKENQTESDVKHTKNQHSKWQVSVKGKLKDVELLKCNVKSCRTCNEDWKPRDGCNPNETVANGRIKKAKFCKLECGHCDKVISRATEEDACSGALKMKTEVSYIQDATSGYGRRNEPIKNEDNLTTIEPKIKSSKLGDYEVKPTRADGNCLYRSILVATMKSEEAHIELRLDTADIIEK